MKIGCLQFAPQIGDTDNNLNRADAVLNKAVDVDGLDLLVLPELAFSGYNFHSLTHISPYLEPSVSGLSSLWARTTALKFNCHVIVGYPEQVNVANKWPADPEYYNAAVIINRDGDTLANYRKSHLYATDETWALEGRDGFFDDEIEGLGNVSLGICMDLNPYKFEAPWDAFEFANHVLQVRSNLVIVSMAWLTSKTASVFSQLPQEPDMETLEYWIERLEPLVRRSRSDEEIIVVFCNRCGIEGDAVYAGTSAVIGIRDNEVNLYGILGRGVKELLVVDTSAKPYAKLVRSTDSNRLPVKGASDSATKPAASQQRTPSQVLNRPVSMALTSSVDRSLSIEVGAGRSAVAQQGSAGSSHAGFSVGAGARYDGNSPAPVVRSSSPASMFNFAPSSPKAAFNRKNHNINSDDYDNFESSPMSTEASWKCWEKSSTGGHLNGGKTASSLANTNGSAPAKGSVLYRRSQALLDSSRPPPMSLEVHVLDRSSNRNSIGAFRDAVGSPPPDDHSMKHLPPSPKPQLPVSARSANSGGSGSGSGRGSGRGSSSHNSGSQRRSGKREQEIRDTGMSMRFSSPQPARGSSTSLDHEAAGRRIDKGRHKGTPPIFFDMRPSATPDTTSLRLHRRSRSTESWDSMTGNSSPSSDGHSEQHQQLLSRLAINSSDLYDSNGDSALDLVDLDQKPEQFYLLHNNEPREATPMDYESSQLDDEDGFTNNAAVISDLMHLLKPQKAQDGKASQHENTQRAPVVAPQKGPGTQESRNAHRSRPSGDGNTNATSTAAGARLDRSSSQPQMSIPILFTPRSLQVEEQAQPQPKTQQQQNTKTPQRQSSRNNGAQRSVGDDAIFFRPNSRSAARTSNSRGRNPSQSQTSLASHGSRASSLGSHKGQRQQGDKQHGAHTRRSSETRNSRSSSTDATTGGRPYSRGRQPTESTATAARATEKSSINQHAVAWPTGRSGARAAGGSKNDRGPLTLATKNIGTTNNVGTPLSASHLERASSAMSFMSGTSFSSSVMATESWLASTPAPPGLLQLQHQLQQQQKEQQNNVQKGRASEKQVQPGQLQTQSQPQPQPQPQSRGQPRSSSASASARPMQPDDEIVAMISLVNRGCPVHRSGPGHLQGAGSVPPSRNQYQAQGSFARGSDSPSRAAGQSTASPALDPSSNRGMTFSPPGASGTPINNATAGGSFLSSGRTAPTPSASTQPLEDDSLYEVFLPPHIRELVESLSNPPANGTGNGNSHRLQLLKKYGQKRQKELLQQRGVSPSTTPAGGKRANSAAIPAEISAAALSPKRSSSSTPKFNPPTPTAMQFKSEATTVKVKAPTTTSTVSSVAEMPPGPAVAAPAGAAAALA